MVFSTRASLRSCLRFAFASVECRSIPALVLALYQLSGLRHRLPCRAVAAKRKCASYGRRSALSRLYFSSPTAIKRRSGDRWRSSAKSLALPRRKPRPANAHPTGKTPPVFPHRRVGRAPRTLQPNMLPRPCAPRVRRCCRCPMRSYDRSELVTRSPGEYVALGTSDGRQIARSDSEQPPMSHVAILSIPRHHDYRITKHEHRSCSTNVLYRYRGGIITSPSPSVTHLELPYWPLGEQMTSYRI